MYDLVIIGAGPGGYVAAIRAAQLGQKVALIEKKSVGGVCLNTGCIPTKTLLKSSEVYAVVRNAKNYGITATVESINMDSMQSRAEDVKKKLTAGIHHLLRKHKVELLEGEGKLLNRNTVAVGNKKVQGKHIIIATGSRAKTLPSIPLGPRVWTARDALKNPLPKHIIIIGSGAIGIEFASFYSQLGVKVSLVESAKQIMPREDLDVSKAMYASLRQQDVSIYTGCVCKDVDITSTQVSVSVGDHLLCGDALLQAVGIIPNSESLGLEAVGIKKDAHGHIVTNEYHETSAKGIFAIGDVCQGPWLAHKASHEGIRTVDYIAGIDIQPQSVVPNCTYSLPEVASMGKTESALQDEKVPYVKGISSFAHNGKSLAIGNDVGFSKVLFHKETGALLGAHIIGPNATELIYGLALGHTLETTEKELMATVFPHPTLSEVVYESILSAFDRGIHG